MVCSNFWRLDKFDKIIIALVFFVGAFSSILGNLCFASSPVSVNIVKNLNFSGDSFNYSDTESTGYFKLVVGHKYRLNITSGSLRKFYYSEVTPSEGVSGELAFSVRINEPIEFVASSPNLFVSSVTGSLNPSFNFIQVEDLTVGYDAVITDLFYNVGMLQLWSVFETSIPWVLVVVLFIFGWWFFTHWVKELGKGREF